MDFYLENCDKFDIRGMAVDNLQLLDVGKLDTLDLAERQAEALRA